MDEETLPLSKAAERADLSREYLARLLKANTIKGHKETTPVGSYWLVDIASLDAYVQKRHKPGPKGPIGPRKPKGEQNGRTESH